MLYDSPVFGPVKSRRLGISLGINLLVRDGKCCTFDCIYCECGLNKDNVPHSRFPSREDVKIALEEKLKEMKREKQLPDVLTFAGNGEPTLNPDFPEIVDDVIALRNKYCPKAKVSVLSNATQIIRPKVFEALQKVDNNILKLDTVNIDYITLVDRPADSFYDVNILANRMKAFKGHCIIQTMFMQGEYDGKDVSNVSDEYVEPWLKKVKEIAPSQVMIYTIDRATPIPTLEKATKEQLDGIARKVKKAGISCSVSY